MIMSVCGDGMKGRIVLSEMGRPALFMPVLVEERDYRNLKVKQVRRGEQDGEKWTVGDHCTSSDG